MIRAIVIDDERASYGVIDYLIHSLYIPIELIGYFNTGESGWKAIMELKPELVFLDIQMPGSSGIDVMREIKENYEGIVNIVVITAYDYFEYAQAALRFGAKDILLKPIDQYQFAQSIENVFGFKFTDNLLFNTLVGYVNVHFHEEILLKDCAIKFHTSPQQISRLFKKYFNKSFISYVNEVRIRKAKNLLADSMLTIKEVAFKVGYNNLNYFYKNFNEQMGMTPKAYMMTNRDKRHA